MWSLENFELLFKIACLEKDERKQNGIYDGPERRLRHRLKFERSKKISNEVRDGIKQRVKEILEGRNNDNIFSLSAGTILAEEFGNILLQKGVLSIREAIDNNFGVAFIHRDADAQIRQSETPAGSKIVLERTPFVTIPDTPAKPNDVQAKARSGELRFEFTPAKTMAIALFQNGQWSEVTYVPTGSIELGPTADRYGQAIFGGNRALKLSNGQIALFRPDLHARRFNNNAKRLLIPEIAEDVLIEIYSQLVTANSEYVPDYGLGSLYIAPGLRASKNQIGVNPNQQYIFSCLAIPAGKIFDKPARLRVEKRFHRAARGGVGDVKVAGNYAPTFAPKKEAKEQKFDDIIYLDEGNSETRELSSSNIFFVTQDGVLVTPNLSGEILDGITRESILTIAQEFIEAGLIKSVEERPVTLEEYPQFKEAFSCGTGVTINPIASIADEQQVYDMDITHDGMGSVTKLLVDRFHSILSGSEINNPRYADWLKVVI